MNASLRPASGLWLAPVFWMALHVLIAVPRLEGDYMNCQPQVNRSIGDTVRDFTVIWTDTMTLGLARFGFDPDAWVCRP